MISILIPIYNGIEFLSESVGSILNQSYKDWEIIIGINGHPPNSKEYMIAKEYERVSDKIKVFDLEVRGKPNALNEMLKYCKYEYVAILDVDDIWHPEKLKIQSKFIGKYDVVGSQCIYFGDINNVIPPIPLGDISTFDFIRLNAIVNSSSITRKSLCYWNPRWDAGVEDYDMWLRLRKQNCKFYNCKDVLVKHRIHNSAFNSSNKQKEQLQELLEYYRN